MLILPTGRFKKNRIGGFTLIELLIVLLIVGLFSALLSIRVEGLLSGGDLRLASRMIIGEINKLRGKAAYSHKNQVLGCNVDENSFYSIEPVPDGQTPSEWLTDERETTPKAVVLPAGVELEDVVIRSTGKVQEGVARIRFFANGCIDNSLIHLRNEKNKVYTLEINPITGQVRIHDRYIDQKKE